MISRPASSRPRRRYQLRLLRDRRLVRSQCQGNVIYYALNDPHLGVLFREAEYHADHVRRGLPDHLYQEPQCGEQ